MDSTLLIHCPMVRKALFFVILVSINLVSESAYCQETVRVEPPSWWIGMKDHRLQLMLYSKGIGDYHAEIRYPGIRLTNAVSPENKNYLFVDLEIDPRAEPGNLIIELTQQDRPKMEIKYPLYQRDALSADRPGYTTRDVIYLVTPDRFVNGDTTNDEVDGMLEKPDRQNKDGRHGGDIEGVRQHLDYIRDMGFSALWLNPVLENNMPQWSYHGYAITDFYRVDPRFGTNESFQRLCREAREKGVKMIMDMIHNHCGSHHWWMDDLPTTDWINYNQQPYVQTNHQKTVHPDPYAAQEDITVLEDGWFVATMPDLNVRNPFLANYLIQNSLWWIEYAGLSGIRMDTYLYPESGYMATWTGRVMMEYPHLNITGEVWLENPSFLAYWQRGKQNKDGYLSNLPSLFDFPTQAALRTSLTAEDTWLSSWIYVYDVLAQDFEYPDPDELVVFTDNHDMARIYAQLGQDLAKTKMALAYILTIRGIPQIYYGTEVLMNSPVSRDDGLIRGDFPGGWPDDTNSAFTGTGMTETQKAMQQFLQKLLHWRKNATAVTHGKTLHYIPENGIYVYFRYDDNQRLMIILNKNTTPVRLNAARFTSGLAGATIGTDILTGSIVDLTKPIELAGPGPTILAIGSK